MDDDKLERLRLHFPVTEKFIYMDHAGVGPLSTDMVFAAQRRLEQTMNTGILDAPYWEDDVQNCRAMYAELIGARPDEVSLIDSTCQGVNLVANGLSFRSGDNIVCADLEYPANVYPWWNLKGLGVETRMVKSRGGRLERQDLFDAMDARTRLLALSFVEFTNGFRNNLAVIGAECRKRNVRFFVDAVQGLGVLRMNVHEMQIDFLAAASKKWLLCPGGKGVFFVRSELLDELRVTTVGAGSVVNATEYLNYDLTFVAGARRLGGGMDAPAAYAATRAMLAMFCGLGLEFIETRVLELTDRLCEGLARLGYVVDSHRDHGEKSGIVAFHHRRRASSRLSDRLREKHVVHTHRYDMIRLSPHFYNTADEVDRVLKALK